MGPSLQLIVFSMILSATVSYALWVRWRVWLLRQDLFSIRDQLWDQMRAKGELDNRDYLDCRSDINGMIKVAPALSLLTFLKFLEIGVHSQGTESIVVKDIAPEVVDARRMIFYRVVQFMLFESFLGLAVAAIAFVFGLSGSLRRGLASNVQKFFDSREIREIGKQFENSGQLVSSF